MKGQRIHQIRHGESTENEEGIFYGYMDTKLTERGVE